jgi:hypothetical protein
MTLADLAASAAARLRKLADHWVREGNTEFACECYERLDRIVARWSDA